MVKVALLVRLEAKRGREADVENFLRSGLPLVQAEPATTAWFGIRLGPSTFGIFDAFPDEAGRNAHLSGRVAAALMENSLAMRKRPGAGGSANVTGSPVTTSPPGTPPPLRLRSRATPSSSCVSRRRSRSTRCLKR